MSETLGHAALAGYAKIIALYYHASSTDGEADDKKYRGWEKCAGGEEPCVSSWAYNWEILAYVSLMVFYAPKVHQPK